MRIAMLAPIAWRTPPRHYGPWELLTHLLTEELVAMGLDVTLFATADSQTSARLDAVAPAPYSEDPGVDAKVWEYRHLSHVFSQADRFDIIHNQADFPAHAFAPLVETPVVTTIHGFSSERILPMFKPFEDRVRFVAISEADRHPDLRYAATIHHGIRLDDFPFDPAGGDDLLFFGRIHPDKGAKEAIEVAHATGHRLHIYGVIQDQAYFDAYVRPALSDDRVIWHGPVGGAERARALGGAKALLHLIGFDEPFGLSVVEAMACGTPVVARRRGSMPELIVDGRTGFLVDGPDDAIRAVGRIGAIRRAAPRAHVARRFTAARMAADYLALYESVLAERTLSARLANARRRLELSSPRSARGAPAGGANGGVAMIERDPARR
ncbi:glycosyltransferase family 4 protein [Pikeienuella sp. HZG-20]|uniref:glycosyltransferase family 4 protein n=1 Tax=Paludibacillus litoralis TaxID=3133267 RepID=UPI0030ED0D2A